MVKTEKIQKWVNCETKLMILSQNGRDTGVALEFNC